MAGLTQQDVTPVIPQVEDVADEEKKDESYQWTRWLTKPGNELKFLDRQLVDFVNRMNREDAEGRYGKEKSTVLPLVNPRLGAVRIYEKEDEPGVIRQGASGVIKEPIQGVVEAAANVGLAGVNLGQNIVEQVAAPIQGREPEPQDPEQTLLGRPLAGLKEASANFLDVPQRYELDPADRLLRDVSGEVAVSLFAAWLIGRTPVNPMGSSTAFTGTKLNPLTSPSLKELVNTRGPLAALLRTKNAARLRPLLRWGSALGVESMATTALIDNRETPYADPGDDQTRAALKSLIPQAGFDFFFTGSLFGAVKGVEKAFQLPDLFRSIARNNKSHNTVNDVGRARTWTEESGLQQRNGEGSYEFIADEKPSPTADAPKNPREAIDLMESSWDSTLPEVDVAVRGLDQLDDEGLTAIASRPPEQPIAEALGEQLNRQQQMRQAQEQLQQVAEARSQQRGFGSDVVEEAPVAPDVEVAPNAPAVEPPQQVIPDQEMFEAIDVPQLQGIAKLDVNVGAELAKAGTSPTTATRRELIDAILRVRQKNAGAASPISAPSSAMPAAQRNEVKKQVIRQAINEGQVRPSATEAPEIPTATTKDIDDMAPFEALDEELRLKNEYQKLDNAKAERIINETREAEGYYQMSPEEQILNGKLDGWADEPAAPVAAQPEFVMPKDLSKSAPRFGSAQLKFESDLDRAAYMLRDASKKSKGEDRLIAALEADGQDIAEVRRLGKDIKNQIQDQIQEATGSRKAPQGQDLTIEVPRSKEAPRLNVAGDAQAITRYENGQFGPRPFGPLEDFTGENYSIDLPNLPDKPAMPLPMEERFAQAINGRVQQLETELKGIAKQLFGDDLPDFNFKLDPEEIVIPKAWGGDGIETAPALGTYNYTGLADLLTINNLMNAPRGELRSVMFHESWHRIQRGYLKPKELKVLDNVFGQEDLANWSQMTGNRNVKQTEVQAVAFQEYAAMRDRGETRMDIIRKDAIAAIEKQFPGLKGFQKRLTANAFVVLAEGWERIRAFGVRAKNLINDNGYQNVYDIFQEAYDGKFAQSRRFEEATRTIDEVIGMTKQQRDELAAIGEIQGVRTAFNEAKARRDYFNKWKGQANTVLNSIDTEIAALKQLATQGGC